ncbi:MAG TPA: DUF3617 family protein [Casimicrobiaceae bacterium]|jgi:hypothetical protein|nr:DUF3617 family protein [Casimicrobiaceae bacterium]
MRQSTLLVLALLALLASNLVWAQDVPKRKSGLWEITRTSTYTQDQPRRGQLCVDKASDDALLQLAEGMRGEVCKTNKISHDGDKLVVDATCTLRASTAQTHALISGNFDSAYTVESKSTYTPPLTGAATGHARFAAKWTGPCPPGLQPGETLLDTGAKIDSSGVVHGPPAREAKADGSDKNKAKHGSARLPAGAPGQAPPAGKKNVLPAPSSVPPSSSAPSQKGGAPAPTGTPSKDSVPSQ